MHSSDSCCSPIDLKSKDATLPDQCTMGSDAPPSEKKMQRLVNDRFSDKCDSTAGMVNDNTSFKGFPGT